MSVSPRHTPLVAAGLVSLSLAMLAGCGSASDRPGTVTQTGVLAEPGGENNAVTYDPAAAPPGIQLSVLAVEGDDSTTVLLVASGFEPSAAYGTHAHVNPCGDTGDAAGPHYQNEVDPVTPSVDPDYAHPNNEIWLDFATDESGAGTASTTVPFVFGDRAPGSIVVHEMATQYGEGKSGEAGKRLACITVPFGR
ncbi:MAG: superoxide dismutase family protein [Pseudonocardiaceae bacterium]